VQLLLTQQYTQPHVYFSQNIAYSKV
jgi:hypothetical protein